MQEEVWEGLQEWKEVEQLEEIISLQEGKENSIEHLQTMTVMVVSQLKITAGPGAVGEPKELPETRGCQQEKHCPKEVWHGYRKK